MQANNRALLMNARLNRLKLVAAQIGCIDIRLTGDLSSKDRLGLEERRQHLLTENAETCAFIGEKLS